MKQITQHGNIIIPLLGIILCIGFISSLWYFNNLNNIQQTINYKNSSKIAASNTPDINSKSNESIDLPLEKQKYTSKNLKISFEIPNKFQINEKFNSIELTSKDESILIGTNGTNYESLEEYLKNNDKLKKIEATSDTSLTIDGKPTIKRIIIDSSTVSSINYYIYNNYSIIFLSSQKTSDKNNIDSIAKSLKFI